MPDVHYTLYDSAVFGVTANNESILFQVAQGADSTHTEEFTNARGSGALPSTEKFTIKVVHFIIDSVLLAADLQLAQQQGIIEIRVADKSLLKLPIQLCSSHNAPYGINDQAAAANFAYFGLDGDGFKLETPIEIPGGVPFRVRVLQGAALSAGSKNMKIGLEGILSFS
jgi:hypothetical protein